MSARRVVPLRPAGQSSQAASAFNSARDAYLRGRFDLAEAYLEFDDAKSTAESGRVALLRAHLARCTGDAASAVAAGTVAARDHSNAEGRLAGLALAAAATRKLGEDEEADRQFARVRKAVGSEIRAETAYAGYLLGVDAWTRREFEEVDGIVDRLLAFDASDPLALSLAGWTAVCRQQMRAAGTHFSAALANAESVAHLGVYMHAGLIHAVAMVAAETADVRLGKRARKAFDEIAWTESIAHLHYTTLLNLRLLALLDGDLERAWFDSREATRVAPTSAFRAMSEIDAASSSRLLGDEHATLIQFRRAWELIRAERWGNATEEERVALSDFAAEAAREMPAEARHAITLYQSLRAKRTPHLSVDEDGRIEGFTLFAVGRVEEAMGERARAVESYRNALETHEAMGQNLRVAMVAADLFRLTRNDEYRTQLDEALKRAPRAWLLTSRSPADELGPKAREILARLLVGESAKTVASELGRSTFTVSNHTRRIFEVFEVHSRDELREKCAELGITPVTLRAR